MGGLLGGFGYLHSRMLGEKIKRETAPLVALNRVVQTLVKEHRSLERLPKEVQTAWGMVLSHYVQDFSALAMARGGEVPDGKVKTLVLDAEDTKRVAEAIGKMPESVGLLNINDYRREMLRLSDEVFSRHMTAEALQDYRNGVNQYFDRVETSRNRDFLLQAGGLLMVLSCLYGAYKGHVRLQFLSSEEGMMVAERLMNKHQVSLEEQGRWSVRHLLREGVVPEFFNGRALGDNLSKLSKALPNPALGEQATQAILQNLDALAAEHSELLDQEPELFMLGLMDLWFSLYSQGGKKHPEEKP